MTFQPPYLPPPRSPGELLREVLEVRGISQSELSRRTGLSPKHISRIATGQAAVTTTTALLFEEVLGVEAERWMEVEAKWAVHQARLRAAGRPVAGRPAGSAAPEDPKGYGS